jgi:carotenoid cleavage dioxygenase-like enzyme
VAEDDGWVLLVVNDAGEDLSRLHIFDAAVRTRNPDLETLYQKPYVL